MSKIDTTGTSPLTPAQLLNLAVDVFAGYIPIFGTAVDVAFKVNIYAIPVLSMEAE
jgi:hypothetical protein